MHFKRNSVEYTWRISSFSATQFTVKSPISSDSQRMIEKIFVVQLQSNFARIFTIGKTILENLTGELDVTNKK